MQEQVKFTTVLKLQSNCEQGTLAHIAVESVIAAKDNNAAVIINSVQAAIHLANKLK